MPVTDWSKPLFSTIYQNSFIFLDQEQYRFVNPSEYSLTPSYDYTKESAWAKKEVWLNFLSAGLDFDPGDFQVKEQNNR